MEAQFLINNYRNYYLQLEKEFLSTRKYVEFQKENYKTFSIEYLNLFFSICSEVEVVGKCLASQLDKNFKPGKKTTIKEWWYIISNKAFYDGVNIKDFVIENYTLDRKTTPWKNFDFDKCIYNKGKKGYKLKKGYQYPQWWSEHNKVKHNRLNLHDLSNSNYQKANLLNVISSIEALYVLEVFLLKIINIEQGKDIAIENCSKMFNVTNICSIFYEKIDNI